MAKDKVIKVTNLTYPICQTSDKSILIFQTSEKSETLSFQFCFGLIPYLRRKY